VIPIRYILRSLTVRRAASMSAALGSTLLVFLLSGSLMLSKGLDKTFAQAASPDRVILLREGAESENASVIDESFAAVALSRPEVATLGDAPSGTSELLVNAAMRKEGASGVANVQVRGVESGVRSLRTEVAVTEGRWPRPGAGEALVGRKVAGRFQGLTLGGSVELRKNRPVTIVGVFSAGDSAYESELWTDRDALQAAFGRGGTVSSIRVKLAGAFASFKAGIEGDRRSGCKVLRESEFYAKQSASTASFLTVLGTTIAIFFGIAAVLGGMSTMQSAVARRRRELGVLHALGFSRSSVLCAVILESLVLALGGSVLGAFAANGLGRMQFSMMNFASWSEVVFRLEPSLGATAIGVVGSVVVGLLAGVWPAIKAARLTPVEALKA
jgi:putative ABC transport system permease protein